MKKEDAIDLLEKHITKLDQIEVDEVWVTQTASLVNDFLGENSDEYRHIKSYKPKWTVIDYDSNAQLKKQNKSECIRFVQGCIEAINIKGVYRKPKDNFLLRLNNWQAAAISATVLLAVLTAAVIGGIDWGKRISDTQNIELRQEIKALNQKTDDLQKQKAALEQQIKKLQNP